MWSVGFVSYCNFFTMKWLHFDCISMMEDIIFLCGLSPGVISFIDHDHAFLDPTGAGLLIKLWDQRNMGNGPIAVGRGHSRDINSIKFASDDRQCVSVASDHSVLVWNVYDA